MLKLTKATARAAGGRVRISLDSWHGGEVVISPVLARCYAARLWDEAVDARKDGRPAVFRTGETGKLFLRPIDAADLARQLWGSAGEADGPFTDADAISFGLTDVRVPGDGDTLPDLRVRVAE